MKRLTIALLFFGATIISHAQEIPLNISFFGESAVHPGFRIGTEWILWQKEKSKSRWLFNRQEKIGSKTKTKQLIVNSNFRFYNHPNNHYGLMISSDAVFRRIKNRKGYFLEAGIGVGYLRKNYNIETYELGTGADPVLISGAGYNQFLTSFPFGLGRDFSFSSNLPLAIYLKLVPWIGFFQGHAVIPNAAFEIGVRYKLKKIKE